jgi:hypothetical protein
VLHRVDAHCSCPCQRRASLVPASVSCHARVCLGLCPQCPISFLCTTAIESQRIEAKGLSPTKTHREIFLESQPKIKGASNWGQNRCRLLVAHDRNPALINRTPQPPATTHPLFPIVARKRKLNTAAPFRYCTCQSNRSSSITKIRATHFSSRHHRRISEDHRHLPPSNRDVVHRRQPNSSPPALQN